MENQPEQINSSPSISPTTPPIPPQPEIKPHKRNTPKWLLIILPILLIPIILGIGSDFFIQPKQNISNTLSQTSPTTPIPTTSTTDGWLSYENDKYSYQYPPDWINGEDGKNFYNLTSPDFQMTPLKGYGIIINMDAISPNDNLANTTDKFKKNKTPYEIVTVDSQQAVQYDEIIAAGTDKDGWEYDYKTITLFYEKNKRVKLAYFYAKDHKNDSMMIYNKFLTTFKLK